MLFALCYFITHVALPQIGAYAQALLDPVMAIVITLAGISMLFSVVGIRTHSDLGSVVVGGVFRAIGYIFRTTVEAVGWIIRSTFRITPRVFRESRRTFQQLGANAVTSNILAIITVIIFLVIII